MTNLLLSLFRSATFALWSLRRRASQVVPVAAALLLLACAVQAIGALHDISSVVTQQQIARSWRGPYDLLLRPQSAVSQLERSAGWIDPQSNLETYGGISAQQIASIRGLGHVVQIVPFATAGWQSIEVLLPVELPQMGVYRISATWDGQWKTNSDTVRYVDVTDLPHLAIEVPITHPIVQHVIARNSTTPVVFTMSMQAIQAVIGVPMPQLTNLREELLKGIAPAPNLHLSLRVERLQGNLGTLPTCIKSPEQGNCWQLEPLQQGPVSYVADGVQLIRYSRTLYSASSQQLANGHISINAPGNDVQGPIYRLPIPGSQDTSAQANIKNLSFEQLSSPALLPFSMPEHLPLLANAVRFVPLEQVCTANEENCYSGLYVRLSGVEHYSQQSLSLLQATAATIVAQTGLHVDILDGSSWRSVSAEFPQIGSTSTEQSMWRVLGVAVHIVHGVDGLQEMLLLLCSLVCLLAIGAAGVLVGIRRRKEVLLLQQVGWQKSMVIAILTLDALLLCAPGCLLAMVWITLATMFWASSLPPIVTWILPAIGLILYCCTSVSVSLRTYPGRRLGSSWRSVEAGAAGGGVGPLAGALRRPHLGTEARPLAGAFRAPPLSPRHLCVRAGSRARRTPARSQPATSQSPLSLQPPTGDRVEAGAAGGGVGPLAGALRRLHLGTEARPLAGALRRPHLGAETGPLAGALRRPHLGWRWGPLRVPSVPLRLPGLFPEHPPAFPHPQKYKRERRSSPASRARLIGLFVCGLATACAVFLIAEGYILIAGFNSELVVTILGRQVREALEGPQLALLLVIVAAALLTVALCTRLLLHGRREELHLLSMVGWERRDTLLHIMRDSWWPALLSGSAGMLLALGLAILIAALPSLLVVLALLLCGPLIGMLLVSLATIGIAWQETGKVYVWR